MAFLLRVVIGGLNGHVVLATRTGRRVRRRGPLDGLQTERIGFSPAPAFAQAEFVRVRTPRLAANRSAARGARA